MVFADHDTQNALVDWCKKVGFDLTYKYSGRRIEPEDFEFHATLVACKNDVTTPITDHLFKPFSTKAIGFEVLGKDRRVPTLKLEEVSELTIMRQYFIETTVCEAYGMQPTFEVFKPHVSLSYHWDGEPDLSKLKLPDFPLTFNRLVVNEFED